MRKRVYFALAILLVALAGVGVWMGMGQREPEYQGKRLSYWLERPNGDDRDKEAIRQIGTNAFPFLIKWLRAQDTRSDQRAMTWVERARTWAERQRLVPFHPPVHSHFKSAELRRAEAAFGYEALGPLACAQIPSLMDAMTNDASLDVRLTAEEVLIYLGPEARRAAPALFQATKDKSEGVRINAYWVLGKILPEADVTIPVLVAGLDDASPGARFRAAIVLGEYGSAAKAAVPALLRVLPTNSGAPTALKAIDPEAAAKAGVE
ncbi:MAG: HEAT repeat domain-containing protein [Limisphaerales bacterium]